MLLKNLMEEMQLDFNQPLLSVRRFSSTVASEADNKRKTDNSSARVPPLPAYKSELKSGPIRNAGTVPFIWEQTPGRPKDESRLQTQAVERPKLPPGRVLKVKNQDSDEVPKGTSVIQSGAGSIPSNSNYVTSLDKNVSKPESQKEVVQEKENSSSIDGDEIYQDALDTLSRTESFFLNCSVSRLSGLDDQEVQPSRCSSTDQQTRDFMIGRFLSAAKAMASETPQYASWKPPIAREQPRQVKKVVGGERPNLLNQPRPKVLPHYAQDIFREESEDEDDDEYNRSVNYATKVCGLFPRFCLLNPIPWLGMQDRMLNSTVHEMQPKSSASRSETGKELARNAYYENKSVNSRSSITKERDFVDIPEKSKNSIVNVIDPPGRGFGTSHNRLASESAHGESSSESPVEKTLYIDSVGMVKSHSGSHSSEPKGQTNLREDDFENFPKAINIYEEPSLDPSLEDGKRLGIVDEKAMLRTESSDFLYSCILSCSDKSKNYVQRELTDHSKKIDSEEHGLIKSDSHGSDKEQGSVIISSTKVDECKKIDSESQMAGSQESSDSAIQNSASLRSSKLAGHVEARTQDFSTLASLKVDGDGKIDLERQRQTRLRVQENSNLSSLQLPLALPSPQAPSESWLKRTLPTVSSRNISSRAYPHIQARTDQSPKIASLNPKWERMVKSSNVGHGHLRFSEEILAPIPEV